jgi:mitogen-activated protein kinase 1/3
MQQVSLSINTKGGTSKSKFDDWDTGKDYTIIKKIGSGSYGQVVEAIHIATGTRVAIKRMEDLFGDEEDCKKMVREILLLKDLGDCPYIARILDIIEPYDINNYSDIYIVLDYVDADLKKVIKSHLTLSEDHVSLIIYNILVSLLWIHSAHVIHRDIKPSNILVDEDCNVRLCDFGLSRSYSGLMS